MRNKDLDKYVIPVFCETGDCGVGFFSGNLFITAGHVIHDNDTHIYFNGRVYNLKEDKAIKLFVTDPDGDDELQNDYAIFKFDRVDSPIRLGHYTPQKGKSLTCISFIHDPSMLGTPEGDIVCVKYQGQVSRNVFNFFECKMDVVLHPGSSGSPIMNGNEVLGILSGNLSSSDPHDILFQSVSDIEPL